MTEAQIWYYVDEANSQAGPFAEAALSVKVASDELSPDTLVWKQGMAEWIKAKDTELAKLFETTPAPEAPAAAPEAPAPAAAPEAAAPAAATAATQETAAPEEEAPAEDHPVSRLKIRQTDPAEVEAEHLAAGAAAQSVMDQVEAGHAAQPGAAAPSPSPEAVVASVAAGMPIGGGAGSLGDAPGAKASLIFGILGLIGCCTIVFSIIAIVKGKAAMNLIDMDNRYSGRGMAKAGYIMGIVALVLMVLSILLNFLGVFANPEFADAFSEMQTLMESAPQ